MIWNCNVFDRNFTGLGLQFILKTLDIPEDDTYFDVHVVTASNPDNITVQALGSLKKLEVCTTYILMEHNFIII